MVINIGALKSARYDWVRHDIEQVVASSHQGGAIVKVIFENAYHLGIFDPTLAGNPVLFQHFFWFSSHPAMEYGV